MVSITLAAAIEGNDKGEPKSKIHEGMCQGDGVEHFLFVLICPTCPQFTHFRCVPAGFTETAMAGEPGEPAESAAPSVCTPFCLSRAIRRSLLRSSRMSSSSSLPLVRRCIGVV